MPPDDVTGVKWLKIHNNVWTYFTAVARCREDGVQEKKDGPFFGPFLYGLPVVERDAGHVRACQYFLAS